MILRISHTEWQSSVTTHTHLYWASFRHVPIIVQLLCKDIKGTSHTLLAISYGRVILYGGCGLAMKQDKFLITIGLHKCQTINHTKCCLYLCMIRKLIELKHLRCGLMYSTLPHAINCSLYNHALLVTWPQLVL